MHQATTILDVATRGPGLHPIGRAVQAWLATPAAGLGDAPAGQGLLTLFCQHTSASLTIQENADPAVRADLQEALDALAPHGQVPITGAAYRHALEGPDDMAAHLRTVLTGVQLSVPVVDGALALGQWQGLYLWEHRDAPHRRRVALHLLIS
ncbi:MAG: secondary thiamine-phosphate synthase enzyme YjbQ [Pseudomonadota bacterium]